MIDSAVLPLGQRYGLDGACVIVTGAAGGIGRALASAFQAQGARLVITDRDAIALKDVAAKLAPFGAVLALPCDLDADAAVAAFAADLRASHGSVDVLVNNAGVEYPRRWTTPRPRRWRAGRSCFTTTSTAWFA